MTWKLQSSEFRAFRRNALAGVILQVRFHPILKVGERIADFQDRVRADFPKFDSIDSQELDIGPLGIQVRNEKAYRFAATSGHAAIQLGTSALSLDYSKHESRKTLLRDAQSVLAALVEVHKGVTPTRLGVRYINQIHRGRIGHELGREVAWTDLLSQEFATVPGGIAKLDDRTNFAVEVTSPCTRGGMTLRYGVLRGAASTETHFQLDTDRYIDDGFNIADVATLLPTFIQDIFDLFMTVAGPTLVEWMDHGGAG